MIKHLLRCVFLAALAVGVARPVFAGQLKLSMHDGRVTLVADNVPVRQILQEWERVGQTRIVNIDRLSGPNVTLQLIDTPEREALDVLLRSASGYIAAPRPTPVANAALYDRVTIFVSTTRAPAQVITAAPPMPTFQRPPQPDDDSDEPINVQMPPQMINNAVNPAIQPYPGMPPQGNQQGFPPLLPQQVTPQQQVPTTSPMPGPLTSPVPGALPTLPGAPPNPYQPGVRPGGGGPGGE
jgi:hypothetical protein